MERKAHCFVIVDLPHSDGCFVKAYPAETTEAFLDGHVSAFAFLGGVAQSILYDNTRLAVAKILGDGRRQRTRAFTELQSHYLFKDRFGRPGKGKGNDKGKVERLVGYVRRNFLAPAPSFESFDALNAHLERRCLERMDAKLRGHTETIGQRMERDLDALLPLPPVAYDACSAAAPSATPQIPSTQASSEEGAPPWSSALVNACTKRVPEPTSTTSPTTDLTGPTSTLFPTPTPEEPSAEVVAYPDLPPPALPASVEAWRDAVVGVSVERASGRTRDQQGLVVADGAVLTVLDHRWEIVSLSVEVSGRGVFTAELERFDPRTGAAMLTIEAEDLTVASGDRGRVAHGEPVLLLVRV